MLCRLTLQALSPEHPAVTFSMTSRGYALTEVSNPKNCSRLSLTRRSWMQPLKYPPNMEVFLLPNRPPTYTVSPAWTPTVLTASSICFWVSTYSVMWSFTIATLTKWTSPSSIALSAFRLSALWSWTVTLPSSSHMCRYCCPLPSASARRSPLSLRVRRKREMERSWPRSSVTVNAA